MLKLARNRRVQGCPARQRASTDTALFLVSRVMANRPKTGLRRHEIIDPVHACSVRNGSNGLRLPEDTSAECPLHNSIHRRTLQIEPDGRVCCPILKFRCFLIREGGSTSIDTIGAMEQQDGITSNLTAFADDVLPELDDQNSDHPAVQSPASLPPASDTAPKHSSFGPIATDLDAQTSLSVPSGIFDRCNPGPEAKIHQGSTRSRPDWTWRPWHISIAPPRLFLPATSSDRITLQSIMTTTLGVTVTHSYDGMRGQDRIG